jgi:hypothetical protein
MCSREPSRLHSKRNFFLNILLNFGSLSLIVFCYLMGFKTVKNLVDESKARKKIRLIEGTAKSRHLIRVYRLLYLQFINSDNHLLQSPFTGQLLLDEDYFALVSI